MEKKEKGSFKAGFLGLIGQPNAGKSSLMNFLVQEKVSIVTRKPQTTRRRVIGVHSEDKGQIVFVDAPGLVKSTSGLNAFLQREAEEVIQSADALVAVLSIEEDAAEKNQEIVDMVVKSRKPWLGVITKTDVREKEHRILILKAMIEKNGGKALQVSNISDGPEDRAELLKEMITILPDAVAPLYDVELFTTENMRDLVEEIIREKCFELLTHEIPYQIAVQTRKFDEDAKPCPKIYVDIMVAKDSQKPIVIGKGATIIKQIGEMARKEIQKMMNEPKVYLELNVVVKDNWYENSNHMKDLKYVIDNK